MPHISRGNTKIGKIVNVSLHPKGTCEGRDLPCYGSCYARSACVRNKVPDYQWMENTVLALANLDLFMDSIRTYLRQYTVEYFRWHVGGDIPNQKYLNQMKKIAREYPDIHFLAYTKVHALNFKRAPKNLTIVLSMWPGWGSTRKKMPRAWMQDGTEDRIPYDAIECSGSCADCKACWELPTRGKDVWFRKH